MILGLAGPRHLSGNSDMRLLGTRGVQDQALVCSWIKGLPYLYEGTSDLALIKHRTTSA